MAVYGRISAALLAYVFDSCSLLAVRMLAYPAAMLKASRCAMQAHAADVCKHCATSLMIPSMLAALAYTSNG